MSLPAVSRQRQQRADNDRHSTTDSYSSSVEDLEHDIDFILNPSLPSRARFVATPRPLLDILPDILPALSPTLKLHEHPNHDQSCESVSDEGTASEGPIREHSAHTAPSVEHEAGVTLNCMVPLPQVKM